MTIAEQLAKLKATRAERQKRLTEIAQKSIDEGRSMNTAEAEEFDTAEGEVKALDADIERLSRLEAVQKATLAPATPSPSANEPANDGGRTTVGVTVRNTQKLEPGIAFARMCRVKAIAHADLLGSRDQIVIAKKLYPDDTNLIAAIQKSAVNAASTGSATWAGNLINEGGIAFADFVEYLRPRSLFGQISARFRNLPFDTPVLVQSTGGTAAWVKEGEGKPLTQWQYTRAKLAPLKVAAIAAATKETLMRASVAADTFLRDELARAVGARIDTTLISDDAAVTDESPAGLLAGTAALTLTGDGSVQGIRCDIAAMLKELVGNNLSVAGAFWVMPETVAIDLSMATNEVGAPAFPGVTPTGGTLAGLPVYTSQYVPVDSAGSVVALIKGDEIFLGDEGGLDVSMSDQASLLMDTDATSMSSVTPAAAQLVSLWQTNSVAFRVERFLNWMKRRSTSVVWAQVNWDACAGS